MNPVMSLLSRIMLFLVLAVAFLVLSVQTGYTGQFDAADLRFAWQTTPIPKVETSPPSHSLFEPTVDDLRRLVEQFLVDRGLEPVCMVGRVLIDTVGNQNQRYWIVRLEFSESGGLGVPLYEFFGVPLSESTREPGDDSELECDWTITTLASIYGWENGEWVHLDDLDKFGLGDSFSWRRVNVEPENIWLYVDGLAGAHQSIRALVRFDGEKFIRAIGVGSGVSIPDIVLEDLDGDGIKEGWGNVTPETIFYGSFSDSFDVPYLKLFRWNGDEFEEVPLRLLPKSVAEPIRRLNARAILMARAGLWKDAATTIEKAWELAQPTPDDVLFWNGHIIRRNAQAKKATMEEETSSFYRDDPYRKILATLVYGDYDSVMSDLREMGCSQLFSESTVTPESGSDFYDGVLKLTRDMVKAGHGLESKRASAYFLRAWAAFVKGINAYDRKIDWGTVEKNLTLAYRLAPDDPLYSQCYWMQVAIGRLTF